jgi:hypothetical protein
MDLSSETIVASLPLPDGARIFWHEPSERTIFERSVTLSRTDTTVSLVASPTTEVLSDVDVLAMRAASTPSGYALLLREPPGEGGGSNSRSLFVPGQPRVPLPDGGLSLVTRGTRFYVPARSYIAALDATGAELARIGVPGGLNIMDPLTNWNERVFALVDAPEIWLHEVTAADSLSEGVLLRNLLALGDIALHPTSSALGVTYQRGAGLELDILGPDFSPAENYVIAAVPGSGILHQSLHETSAGLAFVYDSVTLGSAVVHLQCRP